MPDAIVMVGLDGRVVRVNRQAESLSGYSREELVGMAVEELVPEALRAGHVAYRLGYQARPVVRSMGGSHLDIRFRRRDGGEFPVDIALSPVMTEQGLQVLASVRDVTERKRQDDRLRAVLEVAQATLEGHGQEELLQLIGRRARELTGSAIGVVALLDPVEETLTIAAADGPHADAMVGTTLPLAGSPSEEVLASGRSLVLDDTPAASGARASLLASSGVGPSVMVRLASGERVIGVLSVSNEQGGRRFTDGDRHLLELFATQAAVAIDYTKARDDLQRLAVLEDRERIGRELHDGAIQALFSVGMSLQGMAIMTGDSALRERLDATVSQVDDVIRDLRNYIFGLRPGLAADRHLGRALQELADQLERQHGVVCAVDVDQEAAARLAGRAADIVQMAREALSNVGRHAQAATCRLSVRQESGVAVLEIEDDGRGFVPGEGGTGWGLPNLRERAAAMGGSLDIASVPGEGTRVSLRIPL